MATLPFGSPSQPQAGAGALGLGEGGLEAGSHGYAVDGAFVEEAVVGGVGVVKEGWGEDGFGGGEGGGGGHGRLLGCEHSTSGVDGSCADADS